MCFEFESEGFHEHLQSVFKLFESLLQDFESLEVRVTTVRSLSLIAQYLDADDKTELPLMQVIGQTVEAGDEAGLVSCLNLETLLILKITILAKFIPWLAEFLL
ncbi:hypothetical protein PTI98_009300 [Pleurotus ostreatus]|nr:hypothetical protein PTI98_009300 [Pleurotus ostreatus]